MEDTFIVEEFEISESDEETFIDDNFLDDGDHFSSEEDEDAGLESTLRSLHRFVIKE